MTRSPRTRLALIELALIGLVLTGCAQQLISGPLGQAIYADVVRSQLMVTAGGDIVPAGWKACLPKVVDAFDKLGKMVAVPGKPAIVNEGLILDTLDGLALTLPAECGQLATRFLLRATQRALPGL